MRAGSRGIGIFLDSFLLYAAGSGVASADIRVKRAADGAIVSMSNLSPANNCSPMDLRGRVSNLAFEQGTIRGLH
jgi:hypothetical protein